MTDKVYTPSEKQSSEFPNLCAVLNGTVSGKLSEWPLISTELAALMREHEILTRYQYWNMRALRYNRAVIRLQQWYARYTPELGAGVRGMHPTELAKRAKVYDKITELHTSIATFVTRSLNVETEVSGDIE